MPAFQWPQSVHCAPAACCFTDSQETVAARAKISLQDYSIFLGDGGTEATSNKSHYPPWSQESSRAAPQMVKSTSLWPVFCLTSESRLSFKEKSTSFQDFFFSETHFLSKMFRFPLKQMLSSQKCVFPFGCRSIKYETIPPGLNLLRTSRLPLDDTVQILLLPSGFPLVQHYYQQPFFCPDTGNKRPAHVWPGRSGSGGFPRTITIKQSIRAFFLPRCSFCSCLCPVHASFLALLSLFP